MRMKLSSLKILLLVALLALPAATAPTAYTEASTSVQLNASSQAPWRVQSDFGQSPLYFIANQGQTDSRVAYYIQGSDKTLYFTPGGVTFALTSSPVPLLQAEAQAPLLSPMPGRERSESSRRWTVRLDFEGANPVQPNGQELGEAVVSYFKGERDEWHTGLPTYSKIVYHNLWDGIDLVYSGKANQLKYEFIVRPGADPARIRLAYRGAAVHLNAAGQLEVNTPAGGFRDHAPTAYQEVDGQRRPVSVAFMLDKEYPAKEPSSPGAAEFISDESHPYRFQVGAYDPALPLVIDPVILVYCGYIGGDDDDGSMGIALDPAGNAYIVGWTISEQATFPVTVGPDLTFNGGGYDAFVAKVKANGTGLAYIGYIGGDSYDMGYDIAVDQAGNAYITGDTKSTQATFPVTVGPDLTFNGGSYDAFIAKVKADGTGLVYAGYIGGSDGSDSGGFQVGDDHGNGIAVDKSGNAYVTGKAYSTEATFPVAVGPDLTHNGQDDAFVVKVKANGSGFVYAGYVGGSRGDYGMDIVVDEAGNAYVTGSTGSIEDTFPVVIGPDPTWNGYFSDAFAAKVKADGTGLLYCGYIGGDGDEEGYGIAIDSAGSAYVTGWTRSTQASFPEYIGPDLSYNGGVYDAFVAKVRATGNWFDYAGFIGGSTIDWGQDIAVDSDGNAYVTGWTSSSDNTFPALGGPDLTFNGGYDAFVTKVKAGGKELDFSGFIGGDDDDRGNGIAVDAAGNVYITGKTDSTQATFPVTVGPDLTHNDYYDAYIAKVFSPSFDTFYYLPLIRR